MRLAVALLFVGFASMAACGGRVTIESGSSTSSSGSTSTSSSSVASSASSTSSGAGGADACSSLSGCSRVQAHDGCVGPSTAGVFCDFLATPCSDAPPDCVALGKLVGGDGTLASCGTGQSFCMINWVGTLDNAMLGVLCQARAEVGQPVDCMLD